MIKFGLKKKYSDSSYNMVWGGRVNGRDKLGVTVIV